MCYLIRIQGETSCHTLLLHGTLDDVLSETEARYQPTSSWNRLGYKTWPYWLANRFTPGQEVLHIAILQVATKHAYPPVGEGKSPQVRAGMIPYHHERR
jgi:hypothetical protein